MRPTPTVGPTPTPSPSATPPPTPSPTLSPTPLPLRERVARLLIAGYQGSDFSATSAMAQAIDAGIGGVVLFARNIVSPEQLSALTGAIRERAGDRPFLIAVDQEGGAVVRLGPANGFPATPSEAELGIQDDPLVARQVGAATGQTLARMSINLNLAPVVDLNVNPTNPSIGALGRSFSADPEVVVELATALIAGLHQANVLATLKHFPGLGSATGDTDHEFVDVTPTWTRQELQPFARLVADVVPDAVMVANAFNGQLDARYPSSLSATTVEVLRAEVGWDGVAITDDLQAGALRDSYSDGEIVRLALEAGNDVLLFANIQVYQADVANQTIDTIVGLVNSGDIDEARIDASVARIERMVARLGAGG